MEENVIVKCSDCSSDIDTTCEEVYYTHEDMPICESCFNDNYARCDDCGRIYHINDCEINWVDSVDTWICDNCLSENFIQCSNCNDWYRYDSCDIEEIANTFGSEHLCDNCYSNSYTYFHCTGCSRLFHEDDLHTSDGDYYCDDCDEEEEEEEDLRIYGYHDFDTNNYVFYKSENETPKYYIGVESELEPVRCSDRLNEILQAKHKYLNAVAMRDGSLNSYGVEIVFHPESWNYKLEHKNDCRLFFEKVKQIGYGNNGHAGLHFHVSRPSDDIISRIIVIMESFKEEIKKLSRRTNSQISHWCNFITDYYNNDNLKYQSEKYLKEHYINGYHDRYFALNLQNSNTIEFRFFNGVNNFEEYWGSLQFIHNLMELAYDDERELKTITWKELLKGIELENIAKRQRVWDIDKNVVETTEIIMKAEIALEKAKKEISKTLKNLAKYINKELSETNLQELKTNELGEMNNKIYQFTQRLGYKQRYLERVIDLYNYINNYDEFTMDRIKNHWDSTKNSYPVNTEKYKRYDKMIEKAIKDYESEVYA